MESKSQHNMSISMANPAILTSFDFTAIDEMDPSLQDGSRILYDKELPFHIQ